MQTFHAFPIGWEHGLESRTAGDLCLGDVLADELHVFYVVDEIAIAVAKDWILRCRRHIPVD
jgi:hypothetical protein